MRLLSSPSQKKPSSRQLSSAAENIAAAQFSMYGFDVLEQRSQARYYYDLGVANSDGMMKVSVHGSVLGFWNLVEPSIRSVRQGMTSADRHRAIDRWLDRQALHLTFCLVQFASDDLSQMPRLYLATASEIAAKLHEGVDQLGDTALYEEYEIEDGVGHHFVETLPTSWRFSEQRIEDLMTSGYKPLVEFKFSEATACRACAAAHPAACLNCLPMMN